MEKFINSPFKFLDPYGRNDYNIFFGRDEEIKQLYQHIHKNRLVLVYGTSGTGKTSIVQCGLMNRMDDTDWTPFFIRRGDNINDSLCKTLELALTVQSEPEVNIANALQGRTNMNIIRPQAATTGFREKIYTTLKNVNLRYLRPVYLIFDQFEELLIMGSEKEKTTFISILDNILSSPDLQFCNLLFIMREEFFAGLSEFEKEIPDFCDRRLRIEPMNAKNVEEVIMRSCEKFNIRLQEGSENARQIITVLTEKNTVSLPYLQIYLDQLWRTVYLNAGFNVVPVGTTYPEIVFNADIIKRFGRMSDVLNRFIKERITVIQEVLEKEFPDIPDDFVSNVLDAFVTPEGTKRPLAYLRINSGIWFTGQVAPYLQGRSGVLMIRCLNELEKNKILRTEGVTYELAHDVLAGLIDDRRTEDQRKAGFTDLQIRSRFTGFKEKTSEYLTRKELESYRPYMTQLNLPPEIMDFYNASIAARQKEEQEARDKEDKLTYLKKRQQKMKWGWVAGGFLLISSTVLYFYSSMLRKEFNLNESLVFMGYEMKKLNPKEALNLFDPIREKVYGDDTMKVNQKLMEVMQQQYIQGLFAGYNTELKNPILSLNHFDISEDGKYMVLVNDGRESHEKNHSFIVMDDKGKERAFFSDIAYAYFTNRKDILLLCRNEKVNEDLRMYGEPLYDSPTTSPTSSFILFNCKDSTEEIISLGGPRRFLHGPEDVVAAPPFTTHDSYRVRITASGNLIIPYLEMRIQGGLTDQVQVLSQERKLLANLPSQYTITTSRDYKKFITIYDWSDGSHLMDLYDENGRLMKRSENVSFADFTEDGDLIWGDYDTVNVLRGTDSLSFKSENYFTYANGNSAKNLLVTQIRDGIELINMQNNKRQHFSASLVDINFDQNAFISRSITIWGDQEEAFKYLPWWGENWRKQVDLLNDTLWRRDFEGRITGGPFTHPEGIATTQYNKAKDELLLLTKTNKLLLLNKDLKVKTGLQLTANDRYGLSENGALLYYVRDQYLSVFPNNLDYLNVFSARKSWALLHSNNPLLKMDVSKERRRQLGLKFR